MEENGEYFMSSGTTNPNPIKVYRSPLDLAIMIIGNTFLLTLEKSEISRNQTYFISEGRAYT